MKQTTKRFISLILGLAFLVGSLIVFFEFVQPAYDDAQDIKAKQLSLRSFLDNERATIKQVKNLLSAYQGQGEVQRAVSLALPPQEDLAGAISQLYGLAQQNNGLIFGSVSISLASVAPPPRTGGSGISAATSFALQKPVGSVNFQLKLTGTYEALKAFLFKLENNIRIFDLKNITIQPAGTSGKGPQDLYNYDVVVTAYYQNR